MCGGTYSSEWYWSKIWHCKREDPKTFRGRVQLGRAGRFRARRTSRATLNPHTMKRGICAAGHKAMYSEKWGGLPRAEFLASLDPDLVAVRDHYSSEVVPADRVAGHLTPAVAKKVGLPAGVPVAVGAFDAHMGAVGAGIKPGTLVKIIGTSTCDMMVAPMDGRAAGNSRPVRHRARLDHSRHVRPGSGPIGGGRHLQLVRPQPGAGEVHGQGRRARQSHARRGETRSPARAACLALDWNNGNRTILVDPLLTGLLVGQTLHTTAPEIYRALVEATAFGALTIINRFEEYGVKVEEVVNCGGIAEKNPFVMQIYADVCNRPMKISRSAQTCALGAAIFGAVAAGAYSDVAGGRSEDDRRQESKCFDPQADRAAVYAELYPLYKELHDAFGLSGPARHAEPRDERIDRHSQSGAQRHEPNARRAQRTKSARRISTWLRTGW